MDLKHLEPQSALVLVGAGLQLTMAEPTLAQTGALLAVLKDVELEKLIVPFASILSGAVGGEGKGAAAFIETVKTLGPDLIAAAKPVLGEQFTPAFASAAVACLDTRSLWSHLKGAKLISDDEPETDRDGAYLSSRELRRFVREQITFRQAMHIVLEGWNMAGIAGEVGKLVKALFPGETAQTTESPTQSS